MQQLFDMVIILSILWVYRVRSWPEFFTVVGIIEDEEQNLFDATREDQTMDQLIEKFRVVPFYTTTIDKNILYSSQG